MFQDMIEKSSINKLNSEKRPKIAFNVPLVLGNENENIKMLFKSNRFSGNGSFSQKCSNLLEERIGCFRAIMTSSCTDALEMAGLLCNIQPGDEVIMPSYTFVSTASAFALRKAKIVWCDIRKDTKNIDESKIEALITSKTKAVVAVHYAGVACEMDVIREICDNHNLYLIADAAQAIDCTYNGKSLSSYGDIAAISFHETKNIQCGEGGALIVNNQEMVERAEFIRDKGTNRSKFNKGLVDKYTWVELGSSFLMSELQAAFLYAQLEKSQSVNNSRLQSWKLYYSLLKKIIPPDRMPYVSGNCRHNAHMFYILTESQEERSELIVYLRNLGISALFHYVPLHSAPYWQGMYQDLELKVTEVISLTLLRLPLYYGIKEKDIEFVAKSVCDFYEKRLGVVPE